jgi:hypothetical protein
MFHGVEGEQAINRGESKRLRSKSDRKRDRRAVGECRVKRSKKEKNKERSEKAECDMVRSKAT